MSRYSQIVEGEVLHPIASRASTGFSISQTDDHVILSDHDIVFVDKMTGEKNHFGRLIGASQTWVVKDRLYVRVVRASNPDLPTNELHWAPLSGGDFEMVYGSDKQVAWIASDGDLEYASYGNAIVLLSDIQGTPIVESGGGVFGLAAHRGVLYWGSSYYIDGQSDYLIYSYDVSVRAEPVVLTNRGGAPRVVGESLHWYNFSSKEMRRSALDGTLAEMIFTLPEEDGATSRADWDLCDGYFYLSLGGSLYRYDTNAGLGGAATLLLRFDTPRLRGPVCDSDYVYFFVNGESVYRYAHPPNSREN